MTRIPWLYLLVAFLVSNSVIARQQIENQDDEGVETKSDDVIINRDYALDDLILLSDPDTTEFGKTRTDAVTESGGIIENILPVTDNNQTKPENRPKSSEHPKKSVIGEVRNSKGIEQGPVNRFPSLIPSLEYLEPKLAYELPDLFKFSFVNEENNYFLLVTKDKVEVIHPLHTLLLIGQQALWNFSKEDVIESFTGMEISDDPLMKNFSGWVVTKLINGFPKRFLLFTYSVGNKSFVIEPSIDYLVDCVKHLGGKDIQASDIFNLNGISHLIFDVTDIDNTENKVMQINMFLTGDQTMINNSLQLEQARSSLTASDKVRYYMLSVAKKTADSFSHIKEGQFRVSVNILGTAVAEETDAIDALLIGPNIINGSAAIEIVKNLSMPSDGTIVGKDVRIYMTRYNIEVSGKIVNAVSFSDDLCSAGIIIMTDKEFYKSSNILSKHAALLLGIRYDEDDNECLQSDGFIMSTGTHLITTEVMENSERFSQCAGDYLKKSFEEALMSNQRCFNGNDVVNEAGIPQSPNGTYPGEVFDLNTQCQLTFGQGYSVQWPEATQDICKLLSCKNNLTNQVRSMPMMRAFEGTSCRSGAWCKKNVCIDDKRAPMILDRDTSDGHSSDGHSSDQNFVAVVTLCAICVVVSALSLGFLIFLACWSKSKVDKLSRLFLALAESKDGLSESEPRMGGSNKVD